MLRVLYGAQYFLMYSALSLRRFFMSAGARFIGRGGALRGDFCLVGLANGRGGATEAATIGFFRVRRSF